jgi:hypothetical protein
MRRIWSYGFMLIMTGCVSTGRDGSDAGTYTYNDVLKPHGRQRGETAEQLATNICDQGHSKLIGSPAFDRCMRSRGWRFTHFEPASVDVSPSPDYSPPPPPPDFPPPPPPPPPSKQYDPITGQPIPGT